MKVTKWDRWQTFRKDRGTPPWIKVYRNLMTNEAWVSLTDAEKGQLVSIWILAADKDGSIPDNPAVIQRMAMLDSKPNVNKFIKLDFLTTTCQPDGNQMVTTCREVDAPETEERQSRVEKNNGQNDFDRWWSVYPVKKKKKDSRTAFNRVKVPVDQLIADVQTRIANDAQWIRGFIPYPTTYLRGELWTDDITPMREEDLKPKIPRDDEAAIKFGKSHGIEPNPGESMYDYRKRIERKLS